MKNIFKLIYAALTKPDPRDVPPRECFFSESPIDGYDIRDPDEMLLARTENIDIARLWASRLNRNNRFWLSRLNRN